MERGEVIRMVQEAILTAQNTPDELVLLLEITTDDLLRKFPKKLYENAEKFGVEVNEGEEEE